MVRYIHVKRRADRPGSKDSREILALSAEVIVLVTGAVEKQLRTARGESGQDKAHASR